MERKNYILDFNIQQYFVKKKIQQYKILTIKEKLV
jgi:hypothetical protein